MRDTEGRRQKREEIESGEKKRETRGEKIGEVIWERGDIERREKV